MSDKNEIFNSIRHLHAAGQLAEAYHAAQKLCTMGAPDLDAISLLHMIRLEYMTKQQLDTLLKVASINERVSQSTSQLLSMQIADSIKDEASLRLEPFGYCCSSQNEEDGMLSEVFRRIGVTSKTFFEFGVGSGLQNNTLHFLLQGWKGWWIEINPKKFQFINKYFKDAIESNQLVVDDTMIDAENINSVTNNLDIPNEIDLLSIDIDGNDYHVFDAMNRVKARVVVLEYNPRFPPPMCVVGAYDPDYSYSEGSYIGASLQSLVDLAKQKGYQLVGCSISGINAIFVRADLAKDKFVSSDSPATFYHPPRYQLSFSGGFGAGARANFGKFHDVENT